MIKMISIKDKEFRDVNSKFNRLYEHSQATFIGNFIFKITENETINLIKELKLKKNSNMLDVGCGVGRTLSIFRRNGFTNTIGLDNSKNALELCRKKGLIINKDVFFGNAKKMSFTNNKFDLVFEEGLLEHFKNFQPFVNEMCRISRKYVVLIQPNKFSLSHRFMDILTPGININELSYKVDDFRKAFTINNFKLIKIKNSLSIFWILIFEKIKDNNR